MHTATGTASSRPTIPKSIAPQTNEIITITGWMRAASPSTTGPTTLSIEAQRNREPEQEGRRPDPVLLHRDDADDRSRGEGADDGNDLEDADDDRQQHGIGQVEYRAKADPS